MVTFQHDFPFDPTYGYDLAALLAVPAPPGPDDFADFWRDTFAAASAVSPRVTSREITRPSDPQRVFEVEFDGVDGFRVGGWLTLPRDGVVRRGFVVGHGYGGRAEPDASPPAPQATAIYPCARGMNRSARADLPDTGAFHVLHGIGSRETYIHRACAADLWSAATALLALAPEAGAALEYCGTSFGGGMGALALPWDARFRRAFLEVPSFGNHPLRVTLPCTGSGEAVRSYHRGHPEVLGVLAYFDSATAARHIRIPVLFANALFDPAVPPPGQFAVHNGVPGAGPRPGAKRLHVMQAGHFTWPGEAADGVRRDAARAQWLAEPYAQGASA